MPLAEWSIAANIVLFVAAAGIIGVAGTMLASTADYLADRTGMGEAIMGGLFLGVGTSLPGITASVTAAIDGYPALAVANALGGIAAQTVFLAVADMTHPKVNLEHAAASAPNMMQSSLLILLLAALLPVMAGPDVTIGHVHPGTPTLLALYIAGYVYVVRTSRRPMWLPRRTSDTVEDTPDPKSKRYGLSRLWITFIVLGVIVGVAGFVVARTAGVLVSKTGVTESAMGALFTAVATSLPELVTTIAAVRRGAPTLAVGDIVGGNAFDVLFICVADAAFLGGSIYHSATHNEYFLLGLTIVVNIILLMGLIHREKRGIANIGFESFAVLVAYLAGMVILML